MTQETHYRRPLYRSRKGAIFGVCRGLADYSDIGVGWIRLIAIFATLFTFPIPIFIYVVAAIFMKPEPIERPRNDEEEAFYNTYRDSRSLALSQLKRKFENLERRAQRIEDVVTDREYDWDHRLRTGR